MTSLSAWREATYYVGLQAALTATGYYILELRNDAMHNTQARKVGYLVFHLDGDECQCIGCGRTYHAEDGLPLLWSGRYLAGGTWCSARCRERWAIEAGEVCVDCGIDRPRELGPDGGRCGCLATPAAGSVGDAAAGSIVAA